VQNGRCRQGGKLGLNPRGTVTRTGFDYFTFRWILTVGHSSYMETSRVNPFSGFESHTVNKYNRMSQG